LGGARRAAPGPLAGHERYTLRGDEARPEWAGAHFFFGMEREIETMVAPVVEAAGLDLVDVTFRREAGEKVLRLTVDRQGGVDVDTIAETSERVSRRLDVEGFDPGPYRLELSSPGVERRLRRPADFARGVGQRVEVRIGDDPAVVGIVTSADEDAVTIGTEEGERTFGYDAIASARTVVDWEEELKRSKR
jgi:ribosome maturation factor RimP